MNEGKKCYVPVEEVAEKYFADFNSTPIEGHEEIWEGWKQEVINTFKAGAKWQKEQPIDISTLIGDEKVSDEEIEKMADALYDENAGDWENGFVEGFKDGFKAAISTTNKKCDANADAMENKSLDNKKNNIMRIEPNIDLTDDCIEEYKLRSLDNNSPSIGVQGNEDFNNNPLTFQEVINNYEVHIRHLEEKLKSLQGNVWVKASERPLPKLANGERLSIKWCGKPNVLFANANKYYFLGDPDSAMSENDMVHIEWLSPLSDNKEDADKK